MQKALLPAQKAAMMDEDLKFAAAMIMDGGDKIRQLREEAIKADVLLSTDEISRGQVEGYAAEGIRQVTLARDIGLLTLLSIILLWPDYTFGKHLFYGFTVSG